MKIISKLLLILGSFGLAAQLLMVLRGDTYHFIFGFTVSIGIISLAYLSKKYHEINYKGGAPSIIGALLFFIGIISIVARLEEHGLGQLNSAIGGSIFGLLCIIGGFFLVRSGHRIHNSRNQI